MKIRLNELRSLIGQIIREEIENSANQNGTNYVPQEVMDKETFISDIDFETGTDYYVNRLPDGVDFNTNFLKAYFVPVTIDDNEYQLFFEIEYDYNISGSYYPQTLESPEEYPEGELSDEKVTKMYYLDENGNSFEIPDSEKGNYEGNILSFLYDLDADGLIYKMAMDNYENDY